MGLVGVDITIHQKRVAFRLERCGPRFCLRSSSPHLDGGCQLAGRCDRIAPDTELDVKEATDRRRFELDVDDLRVRVEVVVGVEG